jgi:hypothetical protein
MSEPEEEIDDVDEEGIWETMCKVVAKRTGISIDRAKALLEASGMHAYGHTGLLDAVETVADALELPTARRTWRTT